MKKLEIATKDDLLEKLDFLNYMKLWLQCRHN